MSGEAGDRSIGRGEAEKRELEAAGWKPRDGGAKTIWRNPADGRWYAHYHALQMQTRAQGEEPYAGRGGDFSNRSEFLFGPVLTGLGVNSDNTLWGRHNTGTNKCLW